MVNNRPTEVEYTNGYILKRAKVHGLMAPKHELLVKLVYLMEEMWQYR
ncbi:ketopantoate reductase C-terminal domain-containing protein [Paucilactobacillus vaccinostercus]|jgi:2-dehydropantoate 2-reductase